MYFEDRCAAPVQKIPSWKTKKNGQLINLLCNSKRRLVFTMD